MAYIDINFKLKSVLTAHCVSFAGFQLGIFDLKKAKSISMVILFMWYILYIDFFQMFTKKSSGQEENARFY